MKKAILLFLIGFSIFATLFPINVAAATLTVSLSPADWTQKENYSGVYRADDEGLIVYGGAWTNGNCNPDCDGNYILSNTSYDVTGGADVRVKFQASGDDSYMAFHADFLTTANSHFVTTHHSWDGSAVIPEGTDLYSHITVNTDKTWTWTLCTTNYDDHGGTVLTSGSGTFSESGWKNAAASKFRITLGDNYGGTNSYILIKDASVSTIHDFIVLTNASENTRIVTGSDIKVYGTAGPNSIILESGAKAELFNFPGDNTITIQSDSSLFTVSRSGAIVTLEDLDGTVLVIPATLDSQRIVFTDRVVELAISNGAVILGGVEVMPLSTSAITITEHFPESGPAGSYLALKLDRPISNLSADFIVLYDQKALEPNTIVQTGEDALQLMVPEDAESGEIQIISGNDLSNTVPFTVLSPVYTPLVAQSVSPSTTDQVINYNDEIFITIPSDILDTTSTLSITKVDGAPVNSTALFPAGSAFDVSIKGLEQLNGYIEIKVKYNPDLLNPDYPAQDQFMTMRWNEADQFWFPLPYQVDTINHTLSFYTDHLTLMEWAVIGTVALASIPVSWVGEKLLNDVYVTPDGNFRFLYSKSAINDHHNLNDSTWEKIIYKNHLYPLATYQPEHPRFIQDMGALHEIALSRYVAVHGFQDPIVKPGHLWGTTVNPITVKIDSNWLKVVDAPNYEKLWENIHLPTSYLTDFDTPDYFAYGTIGHELFHRIQAEYYGIFKFSSYMWWIETCAEYAGFRAAWPNNQLNGLRDGIKADFFSYPLNHTGVPPGWGDKEYQYAASVFIQFLVETKGLDFKEMVAYVAQADPLPRLDEFLLLKHFVSLKDLYAEFAAWAVFSKNGFMEKSGFSAADIAGSNGIDRFSIPENDTLTIEVAAESDDMVVNIYLTEENKRFSGDGIPSLEASLKNGDSLDLSVRNLGQSTQLYLLAVSGKDASILQEDPYNDSIIYIPQTKLTVTIKNNTTPVEQIDRLFTLKGNYLAKLWGVNLEVQPEIEDNLNFSKSPRYCPQFNPIDYFYSEILLSGVDSDGNAYDKISCNYFTSGINAQLQYETPFTRQGESPYIFEEKNGIAWTWYEDGAFKKSTPYKAGRLHGIKKEYHPIGNLIKETPYAEGLIHGVMKEYYKYPSIYLNGNEKIQLETTYSNGEKDGETRYFDSNGVMTSCKIYESGTYSSIGSCMP